MFYAPKHSARKANPVRRRMTGVAVAGVATVAGGLATATSALRTRFGISHATIQLEQGLAVHSCELADPGRV